MKGSTAMLAKKLSRNGVGTCASGHSAAPPGVSIHFVHWWLGSYVNHSEEELDLHTKRWIWKSRRRILITLSIFSFRA